jgi:hypothetical protein
MPLSIDLYGTCPVRKVTRKSGSIDTETPFAPVLQGSGRTVGLYTLLVSMVVFAVISLLLMFAARVPAIADSLNDLLGVSRTTANDRPDRSTHLFMLLFCYTSPLMLMLWVSILRGLVRRRTRISSAANAHADSDPFA